jgi:hypothetical protein
MVFMWSFARAAQRTFSEALVPALAGFQPLCRIQPRFFPEAAPR